jgi:hypothetical protein
MVVRGTYYALTDVGGAVAESGSRRTGIKAA